MTPSIRLRIPAKAQGDPQQSQPPSVKRRSSKRRLVDSDEEEEYNEDVKLSDTRFEPPRTKRARTGVHDIATADDMDVDVDIDGEDGFGNESNAPETRFLPEEPVLTARKPRFDEGIHKGKKSTTSRTKKRLLYSDDDEAVDVQIDDAGIDNEDFALDDDLLPYLDVDDDEFEPEPATKRSKSKVAVGKGKQGKEKVGTIKNGKGKGKEKDKDRDIEILMKDERKSSFVGSRPQSAQPQAADLFTEDGHSTSASAATEVVPDNELVSPVVAAPPKKVKKLPTIKKNKQGSTGTSTPLQASASRPPPENDLPKLAASSSNARKPAALMGATDFDLRDKSVYAELFKGPGGSTPRSGLNRREKEEERRKELNKMRDEARARRAEEAKHTFDLQAQAEKIARFERRLKDEGSTALHPNFLAAKFRDEYERERIRKRAKERDSRSEIKEEGEA
ncbi:hypothetical protein BJ138DRAFT_1110329 [Hygrophoropsis aurantiaca]|uniref:Uncharacterized protein n=1 Tax=Hygrophoropsis aurantiaca TaxID=72124 RepID=A0ACB8AN98_9AGAM|nr:hypothetical protein BJ138DRAFT_1110329 [Hygrophoropsis aurantiaca]